MTSSHDVLAAAAAGAALSPFALLRREGADHLEVLTGSLTVVPRLADIPLPAVGPGPATLALVPYRQLTERGFGCVDDGAPLECLRIAATGTLPLADALAALPTDPPAVTGGRFDVSDAEYADTVGAVLAGEIGRGEGANFVIHRAYEAAVTGPPLVSALAALRRLLVGERGAYWTFLVHTGTRTLVGATPERHVSVADGLVMMNPISGTYRHGPAGADADELLGFLADPKEIDELYMVLDEELKMMATVADHGGQVVGPYLKQMAHLSHTEYLLAGRGSRDVREVLRETMFAPTVTGSPLENACRVIARHERRGRGYYGGVLALLGHDDEGRQTLDAPILIRTAEISPDGRLRVPVGATLVRHSTTAGEVAETHTKAAGVLASLGVRPAAPTPTPAAPPLADDPRVRAALRARNAHLADFWLRDRGAEPTPVDPRLAGLRVLVVDAEDTFTGMLAHQLRGLGLAVTVRPWAAPGDSAPFDLVVPGPGPGDPG
ncbi:MAG TPA: chorismate-binding protein, partial [Pilimelia sp.]|nr:chorismate-binding protein [Pilimelia sp.]